MRLYELAREVGLSSADLTTLATTLGITVKNRFCGLSEPDMAALRKAVAEKGGAKPAASAAPAAPAAPAKPGSAPAPSAATPSAPGAASARPGAPAPGPRPPLRTPPAAKPLTQRPQRETFKAQILRRIELPPPRPPAPPRGPQRPGGPPAFQRPGGGPAAFQRPSSAPAFQRPGGGPAAFQRPSQQPRPQQPPARTEGQGRSPALPPPQPSGFMPVKGFLPPPKPRSQDEGKVRLPTDDADMKGGVRRRRKGGSGRGPETGDIELIQQNISSVTGRFVPPSTVPRFPRRGGIRRSRPKTGRPTGAPAAAGVAPKPTSFSVEAPISIKDLSSAIGVKANVIMLKLMTQGALMNINAVLSAEQVQQLAKELNIEITLRAAVTAETTVERIEAREDKPEDLKPRPPVVTFMGHVDHGKTSLLDRIRKTDVAAHEHGGITQHIGANRITLGDKSVVFLDTPGHEAFTAMRSRGANVTDIATLVVAADDGVMPQTEEAIDHAKAAGVPIVVAVNKCDKPEANPQRVRQELSKLGLQPEEWGGDTVFVDVSAITGAGVDELVEMLALVAELRDLKANPNKHALGTVLDANVSGSRGPVATVLVQDGTLRVGDVIVCGGTFGRVKAIFDDHDRPLREAGPSTPVGVVGLDTLPEAGDRLIVLDDIQKARAIAEERVAKARQAAANKREHVSLENLFSSIEQGRVKELRLIIKADVRGTIEALNKILGEIVSKEVKLNVMRASVGEVTTSDVLLADASDALIVGMNTVPNTAARALAEQKGVAIHTYNVIYRVKEEIEKALSGLLSPEEKEVISGHAEVRRLFRITRVGNVAGCYVRDGVIARSNRVRLIRDGVVVHTGKLGSLRREKDDMREVREGFECGMHIEGYDDIKAGDVIESFAVEKVARTLGGTPAAGAK